MDQKTSDMLKRKTRRETTDLGVVPILRSSQKALSASGSVPQFGQSVYLVQLKKPKAPKEATLHILVTPTDDVSDPDLFVSNYHSQPTIAACEWSSQGGGSDHIIVSPHDPNFSYGKYWISVAAPSAAANFNIAVWAMECKSEPETEQARRITDKAWWEAIQRLNSKQQVTCACCFCAVADAPPLSPHQRTRQRQTQTRREPQTTHTTYNSHHDLMKAAPRPCHVASLQP